MMSYQTCAKYAYADTETALCFLCLFFCALVHMYVCMYVPHVQISHVTL